MNQLIHRLGMNQMAPLPGTKLESNGAVATAAAGDEPNGAVAGDGATLQ